MKITFKVHIFYYFVAIICILNGYFRDFVLVSAIILIHELGHIVASIYYGWKIKQVVILPFGGITIFNEILNKKIKEEFIIAIMGPIFQTILFLIVLIIGINDEKFNFYYYLILIFNLLPIYPLDGSKIINLILSKVLPYKISHLISINLSYIALLLISIILIKERNLILLVTIFFLLIKVIKEHKQHSFLYNKFLFERYIYNLDFKRVKMIKNYKNFYRDYKHLICSKKGVLTEKELLKKIFDNENYKGYNRLSKR